jgi:N12 class adenine-specific DNA methylase
MKFSDFQKRHGITTNDDKSNSTDNESTKKKMKFSDLERHHGISYDVNQDYINSFISEADNFLKSAEDEYNKVGWGNASDYYKSRNAKWQDLDAKESYIRGWLYSNKGKLDEETYNSISSALDSYKSGLSSTLKAFQDANKFYSQFDSEDAYKKWKKTEDAKKIPEAEDYEANKGYVSTAKNHRWGTPDFKDKTYEYVNNATIEYKLILDGVQKDSARDIINSKYRTYNRDNPYADSESDYEQKGYDHLKEDEIGIYNYLYKTQGKDKAQEYLDSLEPELVARKAGKEFEAMKGDTLKEIFYGVVAGADQFRHGIENIGSMITGDEGFTPSSQYVSGMIREDLADDGFKIFGNSIGQIGYDLIQSTSNMIPSMVVGAATGGLGGATTMALSSAGNSYADMINQGYGADQARKYGIMVGAAEGGLSYLLSGISSLGGKLTGKTTSKVVDGIDNGIARFFIDFAISSSSEAIEEGAQSILEPVFKMIATREDFEGIDWSEVGYSAMLGALSAGLIEGVPSTIGAVGSAVNAQKYKNIYGSDSQALVGEALELDPQNAHALKMQSKLDKGKTLSGYNIAHLVESNEQAMVKQDKAKIKSAAEAKLVEYGEKGDVSKIAEVITKARTGEKLTRAEREILVNSKYGRRVSTELNPDMIESGEYNTSWAENIGTERINAKAYNKGTLSSDSSPALDDIKPIVNVDSPEKEISTEGKIEASKSISDNATNIPEENAISSVESIEEEENSVTIEEASQKYGAQAQAMIHTYVEGQNVAQYDKAYQAAYDMGKSGVAFSYVAISESTSYLSEKQRELAYEAGKAASDISAKEQYDKIKRAANGKTGRKIGTVKGEGVKIDDLVKRFNDTQRRAYKTLVTIAEVTGIDMVLYNSETNAKGEFEGAQGRFKWSDDKIYLDLNAGLRNIKDVNDLAKYAMLRSFSHEFTHFIEKYNPIWYNEFRKAVFEELTKRGENVNDLIEAKQAVNPGMSYDKASREVVAEAMTDILPDSNFVETLASNHKNIFEKLLDMLKEFLSNIKAYFNSLNPNVSREANALKEQVGETVHYVENIVKLFDKVAVEAVENYQATFAIESDITNNTDGGITNGTDQKSDDSQRSNSMDEERSGGTRGKDENRSRVQETVGEKRERLRENIESDRRERGELNDKSWLLDPNNYTIPSQDSDLHNAHRILSEEYGVETHIVKKEAWSQEAPATTSPKGIVYISEGIDADLLKTAPYHEATHVMKFLGFKPYVEFMDRTSKMLNMSSKEAQRLIGMVAQHIGLDINTLNERHILRLYDELNATVYGWTMGELIFDEEYDVEWVTNAFNDFAAYINDLTDIHNQFKAERKGKQPVEVNTIASENGYTITDDKNGSIITVRFESKPSNEVREVLRNNAFVYNKTKGEWLRSGKWYGKNKAEEVIAALDNASANVSQKENAKSSETLTNVEEELSIEEREKAYKKKFSQWLKKSRRQYVLHYGGEKLLSNGAFGMTATEDEIGWAKLEFSGMITETDIPQQMAANFDNATTQVSEAPLEGVYGNESVYIFNVGGNNHVYSKNLLSKLDGNLFYMGDFYNGLKMIKAVDTEGNFVGFLCPLFVKSEITNTKPSKLKSFSSKFLSQNSKQEVKPNGENVDNRETVQQPVSDRQGNTQVLEGLQTSDVSGDVSRGNAVGDSVERGQQTVRDDVRPDAAGTSRGSSEGDSQSGDLRRDDELTPEAKEKLHEEVTEQIVQQSTEKPKGKDFIIGDTLDLPNGEKARYKANIEAIRLVKQLEAEGRYATEAEQVILSKYVGWGGLANAFDERKSEWSKEYTELKELLSKEEYELARGSTLNAHYTDISVIKAMYDGLKQLGFNGGRMMEPSSGVGNFVGAMPADMSAKVKSWTMVELDGITGLIAKYLYPNADVRIQGFEKANIPNNYMDVIISNVPFGNYPITDKAYPKKVTSAIHNYFFAKSLDKVRPGGIVMFITSSYTMNSKDETVRRYIMQRADLLGAIRLPDSAFKGNAGTEVVTDILVLKKRAANTTYTGEDFLEAPYKYISGFSGAYINTYFDAHPEMVLGTATMDGGMYRGNNLTYKALEGKGSLADQIREAFKYINGKMDYPAQLSPEKTNFAVERAGKKTKENGYVAKDGKIYQNKDGELVEQSVNSKVAERIKGMLEIRDAAKDLLNHQQQGLNENEIKKSRTKLNKVYDAFVKKNGFLNSPSNKSAFKDDPDCFSLFALENWDNDKKTATKADIFSKNTIAPNRTVTSAKDVSEGLIVSVNQTGGVDIPLIARLTGKTEADVNRELLDSRKAFKNIDGVLETAETYLAGNVRAKLRDAEALVSIDSDYKKNVEALKAVMPEDVSYQDIFVNPGTPWIPSSVYSDFAAYMLGGRNTEWRQDIDVTRNPETGNFTVELKNSYLKFNASNTQKWGTPRRSFLDLFDAMLNSKSVVVKDKLDDGSFVINKDATAAANEKIENITKEFQDWLWRDEARRTELATLYNEVFNSIVTPKYNGDNLTVNGANAMKPLRPHQRNAVQRVISSGGNTLLAHKVGAGKTYEMAAAAMKLKQLGLVKKPMFAVPKSLVAQWGVEFIDFFPTAKLLVAEATDFTTANRKIFMNRIANGDYDAVIVSYEQFEKLPVSDDFTRELYQEQINSVIAAIEEAKAEKGGKSLSVKDLEKKRKSLQAKIDKLTDKAKDEGNIDFEELGVDSLFIDEAHNFKNLFYTTSMTNVSGLGNKDGSKRAFDLYTKVRYLQKLNGGKGIVFATATPVMNSMSEMYIMQKYLQPDLLEQLGLNTFDAWAKQFGEVVNGVEIKPSGQGYRVKQSFSRFKNMSELQLLFRNFADVLTDIPGLKIPKMKGGAVNVVVCEPGQFQQDYMKELEKRADNIKNVDPSVDNMLKITSDGRKISYTQRMIDPSLPYEEGCKIYRCAENVIKSYNDSKDIKGTQLIFCDMATPKGKSKTETADTDDASMDMESAKLYDDIKARLVESGIPAKEIAFIHEADTDQKKKKLFADVNDGKVRVLIGSTGKMGVGMNAQKRVVAIHHLDAPWRPGDVEQRNGRAFRQGNINEEVECFTYVTEGSFDARLWDILERKQNFINQVMNGESVGRETEDTGEVTLSAAEVKALASGSPLIMEQVQLDTDIKKLESLYRAHLSSVRAAMERLSKDKGQIELLERMIDLGKSDMASVKDTYSEGKFSITIGKQKFTDKKDAGLALMAEATAKAVDTGYTSIGSFAGFEMRVIKTHEGIKGLISGKQGYPFNTYTGNTTFMINHIISVVEGITEKVNMWNAQLSETRKDMAEQEKLIDEPFAKQTELDEKRKRYNEVMEILNPKEEQSLDSVAEDTVQEQSREYLDEEEKYVVAQAITSAKTSIKQIPALFKHPDVEFGKTNIDIGGGRFDLATNYLAERGTKNFVFDPYNRSEESNRATLDFLLNGNKADTATCANVLNVIAEERARANVILEVAKSIKTDGRAYFMVYEGNGTGVGAETSSGYQNNRKTADYVQEIQHYFDNVQRKGKLITASFPKTDIPKASWEISPGNAIQYQQRTYTLSDHEVLVMAANEVKVSDLTQAENDALTIFQDRLTKLEILQNERAEQGRLYKEQQFGAKVDRAEAEKTLNRMHTLDDQIKKATADVLTVEEKEVLKRVLQKARKVVEAKEREHGQEILARWRDRRNNAAAIKKYRDRLRGDVDELTNWIISPDNKDIAKHVPDVLKNSVIPFLSSINFMSKRSLKGGNATVSDKEFIKRLEALQSAIKTNIDVYGMYSGYNDLPADFMDSLQHFIRTAQVLVEKSAGEFIINQMTSGELKELSKVVRTLKKYIMQINRFHNNAMYQHVYEAGDNSIDFLKELDNAGTHTGGFSNFVFWQQIRPAYAFERFGEGGKAIYDGLRQGQSKLAFNTKEIESFSKKAYTAKEVKAWEDELKSFTLGKDLVKIPVSHIMSFYELTKDPEAKVHIDEGGIRVATYTRNGKKISDVGHVLTVGEFNQIVSSLTPRQREVADSLQKYMATQGGKWGNYVSVARFGEELFTNPNYFPINSDGRHLSSNVEEHPSAASLYALLNMSFTKSRKEGANNRIVLYSIFDVFANHMASMAQYNAMALPILDALKWFNYQQVFIDDEGNKTVTASIREQMDRVYGVPEETKPGSGKQGYAETFIVNIIKAYNGTAAQGTPYDTLGLKSMHAYNIAQVAYNFRVVLQQPLAITRAGMLVSYRSILKGLKFKPSAIKKNIEEMQKYSGIAAWKSLGFYDVNISRGLTHLIKHDTSFLEKIGDIGMWGAEKADTLTWSAIWSACKEEVTKKEHLTPESEGFFEAVTKLFEDVIYKTQVVDSILTKNEFMRDKGTFARLIGSFMSEATTNASMLIDAVDKYHLDIKRGMTKQQAWQKNGQMIGRTLYVFGVGAVLLAAVQAIADAFRDDDDYEEWYEKWLEAFGGNLIDELMPFNKLPIIADFYDLSKSLLAIFGVDTYGNPPQSVFMQWYDSLVKGTEIIYDKISGEDTNYTWYGGIYKLLQAVSGMSGLPMASATREIITAWNNTVGAMAPSLKVKTYEPSELSQIRYAYEDGYLTAEEATKLLLEQGLADNENEAYFIIQGWEAGEGYSRYDALYDAVLKGESITEAMNELSSHGYTEKDVLSRVKSKVGEWYQSGKISKTQAVNMLTKYCDMDSDEITATVNKWSSYVVTGIKYEDIDDEFIDGNMTASRAIEMYVRYGSMTREKATEKVAVLSFVKEHPETEGISYSAVNSYKTYCEPYGVTVDIYYDAWKYKNNLSGTVKEDMLIYINSLNLSTRQKDSLYYAFGWAESKIYETPWH